MYAGRGDACDNELTSDKLYLSFSLLLISVTNRAQISLYLPIRIRINTNSYHDTDNHSHAPMIHTHTPVSRVSASITGTQPFSSPVIAVLPLLYPVQSVLHWLTIGQSSGMLYVQDCKKLALKYLYGGNRDDLYRYKASQNYVKK